MKSNNLHARSLALYVATAHFAFVALMAPIIASGGAFLLLLSSGAVLAIISVLAVSDQRLAVPFRRQASGDITTADAPCAQTPDSGRQSQLIAAMSSGIELVQHPAGPTRPHGCDRDWADLMSRVSHELRTPLNAVLGFSDVMDRGLFGPLGHQRYQEYARHIHDSGRELLKSAEDTLAVTSLLAAPERHRPTDVVDLEAVVADAWQFLGHKPAARRVQLDLLVEPGTEVLGDRRTLRQALVNLLSEALARTSNDSRISVGASRQHCRTTVRVAVRSPSARVHTEPGSLHAALARTLLEFHGAPLSEHICPDGGWHATTCLDLASQRDLFACALVPASPALAAH